MPAVGAFERQARAVRRVLRRYPFFEPAVSRVGTLVWRWNLRRSARRHGLATLPTRVEMDPRTEFLSLELSPSPAPADEVAVAFDRLGRTCVVAGHRRLAAAREQGLQAIPATVVGRHERWARLASEVRAYAMSRGGTAYQPYLHPDLADIPSDQGHERFELLLSALPVRSGKLLDLGANAGYFSHRFEQAGFDCIAAERSEKEAHFLTALRDAAGRRFTIVKGSFTEVELPRRPDVVLALNVFHHFLKTHSAYRQLKDFLGRLAADRMLFQAHLPDDPQMRSAAHDMAPSEFVEWVRVEGGFSDARRLGAAADDRPIYLLSRHR
jgi:hypothetical protein